jgi:hypothetical protein
MRRLAGQLPYSSGTTVCLAMIFYLKYVAHLVRRCIQGPPKGVILTHYNLVSNVLQFLHQEGTTTRFNPSSRDLRPGFIPLFHM